MSQSLLLKIVRESIAEVFEAKKTIDKAAILQEHPVLNEPIAAFVSIYLDKALRAQSGTVHPQASLLDTIIFHAKAAAFEDENNPALKVSEYIKATIELSLLNPAKELNYETLADLKSQIRPHQDGISILYKDKEYSFLPQFWSQFDSFEDFFTALLKQAGLKDLSTHPKVYLFQCETSSDAPIIQ